MAYKSEWLFLEEASKVLREEQLIPSTKTPLSISIGISITLDSYGVELFILFSTEDLFSINSSVVGIKWYPRHMEKIESILFKRCFV